MAVHDVSKLLDLARPAPESNSQVGTLPDDGKASYLDALKRTVKPKPELERPAPSKTKRQDRPVSRREREQPEPERTEKPENQPAVGASENQPRRTDEPKHTPNERQRPVTEANSRQAANESTSEPSNAVGERSAGALQTVEIQSDQAAPPPAHIVQLFGNIDVSTNTGAGNVSAASTDPSVEPAPPAGLAGVLVKGPRTANSGQQADNPTPGAFQGIVVQAPGDAESNAAVSEVTAALSSCATEAGHCGDQDADNAKLKTAAQVVVDETGGEANQSTAANNGDAPANAQALNIGRPFTSPVAESAVTSPSESPTVVRAAQPAVSPSAGGASNTSGVAAPANPTSQTSAAADTSTTDSPTNATNAVAGSRLEGDGANAGSIKAIDRGQFAQRVVSAVRNAVAGNRSFRMVLHPPELGTLQVEIATDASGRLTARLEVQTQAAQQALQDNLTDLRSSLGRQGVTLERIEIQLNEPSPSEDRAFQDQDAESRQHEFQEDGSRREDGRQFATSGEEDEPGVDPTSKRVGSRQAIEDVIDVQV